MSGPHTPAFEATSRGLLRWAGREVRCALGKGGVIAAESKREGDGATPLGIWPMRQVFWRPDRVAKPQTRLPTMELRREAGWCDEPASQHYNTLVQLPFPMSHEKLWREDHVYDLIVPLGYNDGPIIPGHGSAIFLHVARPDYSPTEGCVACALDDLRELIATTKPGDVLAIVREPSSR